MKYLIIGAVAAGATTAARLRRLDEDAEIIVFEKGQYASYSNCGLPYRLSGDIPETDKLILLSEETLRTRYKLDIRLLSEVLSVDPKSKKVKVLNHNTGEEYEETYDKLVLTPGSKAIVPNFPTENHVPIYKLKTVEDTADIVEFMGRQQKNIAVIGGGFIGLEVAENLQKAGYNISLIEGGEQVLSPFDYEMSLFANKQLEGHGVNLILNKKVNDITSKAVILDDGTEVPVDAVIMSIGVRPATEFIKDSGIDLDERGYIKVDDKYRTSDENIYAAGDAIVVRNQLTNKFGPVALAGPANKQGRFIADVINGYEIINKGYIGTAGIKLFDFEMAVTGLNEKELKDSGINYDVCYSTPFNIVKIMPNAKTIFLKLLFDKDSGKILGAQAASQSGAPKRIDIIATAIKAGMTVDDLLDLELTYAPSIGTGKDAINKAGYIAQNIIRGIHKQVSFQDIYDLLVEGAQIIDVRTKEEVKESRIQRVKNIPMEEIRNRIDEIDKSKPVYLLCQSAERSYNVMRALEGLGFDAYNIAGGMKFLMLFEEAKCKADDTRKKIIYKR